jgi:large repetitive protein
VTMNPDGTYTYRPAGNFAGTDTFTYQIKDPTGQIATATETIIITPPAIAAVNDRFTTGYNTPVNGNASNGDTFAPGSKFVPTSTPAHGTVTMAPDGTYVYRPATGFIGTDTFTYKVTDPTGQTRIATETIVVSPPSLTAVNHARTTSVNVAFDNTVSTGDTYTLGSAFTVASKPSHGTVVMKPDGSYRYVPARGYAGTDTFTYQIKDPSGQTVTATETITIAAPKSVHFCLTTFGKFGGKLRR